MNAFVDFGQHQWQLCGWVPHLWEWETSMETGEPQFPEIPPMPVELPASVQGVLLKHGRLPDWTVGFNARACEWVENRHWDFFCTFEAPFDPARAYELVLPGADAAGWVLWDRVRIARFDGAHRPHRIALPAGLQPGEHRLDIIFDCPQRFLGQFGRTREIPVTKPRYYYTWDWTPRLVQIGLTAVPRIVDTAAPRMTVTELWSDADAGRGRGILRLRGELRGAEAVRLTLGELPERIIPADQFARGVLLEELPVDLWQPNLEGEPVLYDLTLDAGAAGAIRRKIGFKAVRWLPCRGAPEGADPWICEVNGKSIFLQGFNWTPIRANYADLRFEDYRSRLEIYRDMGCNILRMWGGATLEPDYFYDLCDQFGILVWQEFPMSSSGLDNTPPCDAEAIREMQHIARHYFRTVSPHVSLLAWSGGNELQRGPGRSENGCGYPCGIDEPILGMLASMAALYDPRRRFMATSATGPYSFGDARFYGTGLLWEVHGPWKSAGPLESWWRDHWDRDDTLFRAEFGHPAASDAAAIRHYAGSEALAQPFASEWWDYPLTWWNEKAAFTAEFGRLPHSLEEYAAWSRQRQAAALKYAVTAMKRRFPACGGGIIWMGHACFPCPADPAVIDFDGRPRPAVAVLSEVFHAAPEELAREGLRRPAAG